MCHYRPKLPHLTSLSCSNPVCQTCRREWTRVRQSAVSERVTGRGTVDNCAMSHEYTYHNQSRRPLRTLDSVLLNRFLVLVPSSTRSIPRRLHQVVGPRRKVPLEIDGDRIVPVVGQKRASSRSCDSDRAIRLPVPCIGCTCIPRPSAMILRPQMLRPLVHPDSSLESPSSPNTHKQG